MKTKKTEPVYKENTAAEFAPKSISASVSDTATVWLFLIFIAIFFAVAANYQSQQTATPSLQVLAKK